MPGPNAIALCVHHKPWLAMSTLLTALVQDDQGWDIHFVHNLGDGKVARPSYAGSDNTHLSPYDPRVRVVCDLNRPGISSVEYENDHTLDSGAFYKFIRDARWRPYEFVLFAGEGTLFARANAMSATFKFARERGVHFIASGHEKRRLPRELMLNYYSRHPEPSDMDRFHDEMIRDTFAVFCRDPEFQKLFDAWPSAFAAETQHHVPQIPPTTALGRRVRAAAAARFGSMPYHVDALVSEASMQLGRQSEWPAMACDTSQAGEERVLVDGVAFHRVSEPEWFGCTPILMMSRAFLERLAARMERFHLYDVLDLPFAATGLEIVWGFMPAWLGVDKWFTDGFHRVRKDFVNHRREDNPPEIAGYINRYHRGRLSIGWAGDYLKVRATAPGLGWLKDTLPAPYF